MIWIHKLAWMFSNIPLYGYGSIKNNQSKDNKFNKSLLDSDFFVENRPHNIGLFVEEMTIASSIMSTTAIIIHLSI